MLTSDRQHIDIVIQRLLCCKVRSLKQRPHNPQRQITPSLTLASLFS